MGCRLNHKKLIRFYPYSFMGIGGEGLVISPVLRNHSSPEIAISQSDVFVIWKDQDQGNGDIMMKRISKTHF